MGSAPAAPVYGDVCVAAVFNVSIPHHDSIYNCPFYTLPGKTAYILGREWITDENNE